MAEKKVRIVEDNVSKKDVAASIEDEAVYWMKCKKPTTITFNFILIFIGFTVEAALLWHRIAWGFEEWIHEVTFFNFWHGTYVTISGIALLILTCTLGIWSVFRLSIPGLAVSCVMHGTTILLLFVGSVAMLSDAFTTREDWIGRMILDLMDPIKYNHNSIKDSFLSTMFWMAECCGADSFRDYPDRFGISPPEGCINRKHAGSLYYEKGCSHKFSVWLKAWSGGMASLVIIIAIIEVLLIIWNYQLIKILKAAHARAREQKRQAKTPPRQRKPIIASAPAPSTSTASLQKEIILQEQKLPPLTRVENQFVQSVQPFAPSPSITSSRSYQFNLVGHSDGQVWPNGNLMAGNIMPSAISYPDHLSTSTHTPTSTTMSEEEMPMLPRRSTSLRQYPHKVLQHKPDPQKSSLTSSAESALLETTAETIILEEKQTWRQKSQKLEHRTSVETNRNVDSRQVFVAKSTENLSSTKPGRSNAGFVLDSAPVRRTAMSTDNLSSKTFVEVHRQPPDVDARGSGGFSTAPGMRFRNIFKQNIFAGAKFGSL